MRSRLRHLVALFGIVVLGAGALVALAPAAVADTIGPVDASIPDGDPGSLRDVIQNQDNTGDVVELQAGAVYDLTCDAGGHLRTNYAFTLVGNGATIRQTCDEYVMEINYETTLDGVTITGGYDDDDRPAGGLHIDANDVTILNSSIVNNQTCGSGGGILMDGGAFLHIENSTIAGNTAAESGGAIGSYGGSESIVEIVNSTITGNSAAWGGGVDMFEGGQLALTYVTLAGNTTDASGIPCESDLQAVDDVHGPRSDVRSAANGSAANVQLDDPDSVLTTFGSVIALPVEGPNCSVVEIEPGSLIALSNTDSQGYNYSDDTSCDLTGTGDRQGAADPQLGPLGPNGGATETRVPAETSPLIDGVALAACHPDGIDADQRGIARPQGTGCDIGAVELVAVTPAPEPLPLVVTPRFTG